MRDRDAHSVAEANVLTRFAARVVATCVRLHVPVAVEKPSSSMLFAAPPLKRLVALDTCRRLTSDYCQYGTKWRKRTTVMAWHC